MNIKRKLLSFWLVGIMALTVLPLSAFADGEAAETPPLDADGYYLLDSPEDLYWFSGFVNGRSNINDKVNARLAADINLNPGVSFAYNSETGKITAAKGEGRFHLGSGLNGTTLGALDDGETPFELNKWTPIGKGGMAYVGTFDGNGHTVDGVYVNDENIGYAGFFGLIGDKNANNHYSGHVKDLAIGENSLILGYKYGRSGAAGGIAGMVMSIDTLTNCVNRAAVVGRSSSVSFNSSASSVGMVGGIVGCMAGKAENCENYGTVISDNYAGGIAGNLTGGRTNTYAQAYVSLENCRNYGEVYGNEDLVYATETSGHAGGIVGNSGGGDTFGCDGGIIAGCINFGKVRASGAAGVVYQAREGTRIKHCANRNEIAATLVSVGLVGQIDWGGCSLESSYNAARVTLTGKGGEAAIAYPIAGLLKTFLGNSPSYTVQKCYNDSTVHPCEDNALAGANININECSSVATSVFATGEPAYKMGSWYDLRWKQNIPEPYEEGKIPEDYPNITGTRIVSYITHYCCHTDATNKNAHKKSFYSNLTENITDEHTPNEKGICTHCNKDLRKPIFSRDVLYEAKVGKSYNVRISVSEDPPSLKDYIKAVVSETDDTEYSFTHGLTGKADYNWRDGHYYDISGVPTETGTLRFTLCAENNNGITKKTYMLKINESDPLKITTQSKLDNATVGSEYSRSLSVNSDIAAAWSVADGSSLPPGLLLNRDTGAINGTPTESGKYTFSVTAECADMITSKEFNLTVLPEGGCLHEELTCIPGTAATCMKDGIADYYYCGFCDRYYKDEQCKKQIWNIEYALKSELKTTARHTDENNDGVCDFCYKPMPMFIKVTDEKDIVYGGTYIFVAEIGGKYYALKTPPEDSKTGERRYSNVMGVAEIIPDANGEFAFNALYAADAIMLKTEFAAECGPLDAGKPRYGLSTVFENARYGLMGDYNVYNMYPNEPAKYGYRIALEPDKTAKIASVYNECWNVGSDGKSGGKGEDILPYGILRTFDMNYNEENTKFMTMQTESYYNGEKQLYSGAQMTQYPIYLYKMTVRGTAGGKNYTVSDSQNNVNISELPGMLSNYQGLGLSNVSGLTNAVNIAFITDTVANVQTEVTALDTRAYADISVNGYTTATDEKGNEIATSITYSVTPHLSVADADGAEISSYEITDESLNGAELTVSLHTGGIEPQQVIHYKKDGAKEFFYPEYSEPATNGAKTFEYESDGRGGGFVTIRITDFSDIKILAEAEPETDYAIRYDGKTLAIDCEKGGAYTIVFASYDTSGKMTTVKTLTAEFNAGVNSDVKIPEDVTLEVGDKIFLWENLKTLRPLCNAYTVNK